MQALPHNAGTCAGRKLQTSCPRAFQHARPRRGVAPRASASTNLPSLQLGTAKLPPGTDTAYFAGTMYNWAAGLTQSGANLPFSLPLRADKLPNGFQIGLLRSVGDEFKSVANLVATVEAEPGVGDVFFIRFYEGPGSAAARSDNPTTKAPEERLELLLQSCVDINLIMQTMPNAIRKACARAS